MRLGRTLGSAAALLLLLTACGSDGDVGGGGGDSAGSAPRDLPFTTTVPADPGELHPHLSTLAATCDVVAYPANQSPVRGIDVPAELEVSADDEARTVTVSVEEPNPFLLHGTGELFIACRAGVEHPSRLKAEGIGTGMYELTEAVPNDHYTLQRR